MVTIITDVSQIRGAQDVVGKVVDLSWRSHSGIEGGNHLVNSIVSVGGESFLSVQRINRKYAETVHFHVLDPEQRLIPVRQVSFQAADWYPNPRPSNQGAIYSKNDFDKYDKQIERACRREEALQNRRDFMLASGALLTLGAAAVGFVAYAVSSPSRPTPSKRSLEDLKLPERPRRD